MLLVLCVTNGSADLTVRIILRHHSLPLSSIISFLQVKLITALVANYLAPVFNISLFRLATLACVTELLIFLIVFRYLLVSVRICSEAKCVSLVQRRFFKILFWFGLFTPIVSSKACTRRLMFGMASYPEGLIVIISGMVEKNFKIVMAAKWVDEITFYSCCS